jgi:putative flippase GtrA
MTIGDIIRHALERFWLLFRYGVSGAFGAFVQTFSLYVWVSLLGFHETYLLGAFIGFCLALIVTFALQKFWTFRDRTMHQTHKQLAMYSAVAVLNVIINIVLLAAAKESFFYLGINFFAGWYIAVQAAIVIFASGVSFLINYFYTFKAADSSIPL